MLRPRSKFPHLRTVAALALVACAGLGALAAYSRTSTGPGSAPAARAAAPAAFLVEQGPPPAGEHRVLHLTLRPTGFEPAQVTVPEGPYLVVVNNRTGLDEFALRLAREHGAAVHEARPRRYQRSWRRALSLAPGAYVLTETNNPKWSCRVTVTAR